MIKHRKETRLQYLFPMRYHELVDRLKTEIVLGIVILGSRISKAEEHHLPVSFGMIQLSRTLISLPSSLPSFL